MSDPEIVQLCLDGWGGRWMQFVELVGETPTRYRIRALGRTRLGGRNRWLEPDKTALVPKRAIIRKRAA
jgi:hypothetical protein